MKKVKISACLIVKNEKDYIEGCLKSIQDKVDEIVVVDTGSDDKTPELAKKYADKVEFYNWDANFSNARNESLKYATHEWVFIIDADERLSKKADLYKLIKTKNSCDGFQFWLYNYDKKDKFLLNRERSYPRLFLNSKAHFEGNVHNQVVGLDNICNADYILNHYGYTRFKDIAKDKKIRTEKLLEKNYNNGDKDYYTLYNYFKIEMSLKKFKKSKKIYNELIEKEEIIPKRFKIDFYYYAAALFYEETKWKKVIEYGDKIVQLDNKNIDGYYWKVIGFYNNDNYKKCVEDYEEYVKYYNKIIHGNLKKEVHSLGQLEKVLNIGYDSYMNLGEIPLAYSILNNLFNFKSRKKYLNKMIEMGKKYFMWENLKKIKKQAKKKGWKDLADKAKNYYNLKNEKIDINLSACLIVRDEEKYLDQCLSSIENQVDEIIVVDTGSIDNTVDIAKKYTDKVYFFKWINDFSAARRESLKYANGNWVFIIDADEQLEIVNNSLKKEIQKIYENGYDSIKLTLVNWTDNLFLSKGMSYTRIMRKKYIKFMYAVHNQVRGQFNTYNSSNILNHYGYDMSTEKRQKRLKQTEQLLLKELENTKRDKEYFRFQLGVIYFSMEKLDEAVKFFKKALQDKNKLAKHNLLEIYYFLMVIYRQKEKEEKMKKYAMLAINVEKDYLDIYYILGRYYHDNNRFQYSKLYFSKYLKSYANVDYSSEVAMYSASSYANVVYYYLKTLSNIGYEMKDLKIIDENNYLLKHEQSVFFLGQMYEKISIEETIKFYDRCLKIKDKEYIRDNLSDLYIKAGKYKKAIQFCNKSIEMYPDSLFLRNNLSLAHWYYGQKDKAVKIMQDLKDGNPNFKKAENNLKFMKENMKNS